MSAAAIYEHSLRKQAHILDMSIHKLQQEPLSLPTTGEEVILLFRMAGEKSWNVSEIIEIAEVIPYTIYVPTHSSDISNIL